MSWTNSYFLVGLNMITLITHKNGKLGIRLCYCLNHMMVSYWICRDVSEPRVRAAGLYIYIHIQIRFLLTFARGQCFKTILKDLQNISGVGHDAAVDVAVCSPWWQHSNGKSPQTCLITRGYLAVHRKIPIYQARSLSCYLFVYFSCLQSISVCSQSSFKFIGHHSAVWILSWSGNSNRNPQHRSIIEFNHRILRSS